MAAAMRGVGHYFRTCVGLGIVVGLGLWLYMALIYIPEDSRRRLSIRQDRSAWYFWLINANVLELRDKGDHNGGEIAATGAGRRAWERYVAQAIRNGEPVLENLTREQKGDTTILRADVDGLDGIKELWVAVPDHGGDYVAFAVVSVEIGELGRVTALAYSPSNERRIFVSSLGEVGQAKSLFRDLLRSRNWERPLEPAKVWDQVYEIGDNYPQVGMPRSRAQGD